MAQEEVLIGVKVDTKDAQKSLAQLQKSTNEISKSTEKNVKELNTSVSSMTSSFSEGISDIGDSFGSLGAPLASAKQGVASLGKAFKALLANPVVLVIAAIAAGLTALYKAFTRTEEGANKMAVAFAYLEGLLIPLIKGAEDLAGWFYDLFTEPQKTMKEFATSLQNFVIDRFNLVLEGVGFLGSAIKKLFSSDFSGALEDATKGFVALNRGMNPTVIIAEELGKAMAELAKNANEAGIAVARLEANEQRLVELNRENQVLLSEQLKDREQLMNIRDNELLSIEERIAANEELNKLETEQLQRSEEAALLAISIAQERIKLQGKTTENLDALAAAQIEYNNVLADSAGRQNEYIMNRQGLQREEAELARIAIDFELEKVNITEKSEEVKLQARIDALDKTAKLYGEDTAEYKEFTKQKELAELELSEYKKDLAEKEAVEAEERRKKEAEKRDEERKIEEERVEAQRQANIDAARTEAETLTNEVANAIFEAQAANIERQKEQRLNAVEETQNRELEIINARLEKGLINEEQAAQQRTKIEEDSAKETERIEKEALKQQQKADISQAVSNGAIAITKTLANLGFPLGAIAAAGVAAQTAIQVATIRSQKFAKGGIIEGASHADGGVPFTVDGVGGFEAEGGEVIINKRSAAMFRNELSMINQAGGGVKFAEGGVVGTPNPADNTNTMTAQLERLIAASERPTRAIVSETEITDSQNRINNIENRSSF